MVGIQDFKSILITGATSGIGRALARALTKLESKPRVIGVGRRDERLQELKNEGIEAIKFDTDTDDKGIQKFVDNTLAKYPDVRTQRQVRLKGLLIVRRSWIVSSSMLGFSILWI